MYYRNIDSELLNWKNRSNRKPLILRGARQVGKTTIINHFSNNYAQFISLNLERPADADLFLQHTSIQALATGIFYLHGANFEKRHNTLIFIDEIQEVPDAINLLRYFYEDFPEIHVVAAGSLLEIVLSENTNVPVGRVEYLILRPVSFDEFLGATGETQSLEILKNYEIPDYAHDKLMSLFNTYTLIGGMPEVVQSYATHKNLSILKKIYESLLISYQNDFEKYAKNTAQVQILRQILKTIGTETGNRIKFQNFGNSNYGSREVGEALRTLEKALLVKLIYPCFSTKFPLQTDFKKSPKLQFLDTGLFNKMAGIQKELIRSTAIELVHQGKVAEHIVGQELLTPSFSPYDELKFWTRENKDSNAEVDYLFEHEGFIIPVEVKLGASGRLRSLHSFIDEAPHNIGVRVSSNKLKIETHKTIAGKEYKLLNIPFYLVSKLSRYIDANI